MYDELTDMAVIVGEEIMDGESISRYLPERAFMAHEYKEENQEKISRYINEHPDTKYIEHQENLTDIYFGLNVEESFGAVPLDKANYNSCGAIATYNALVALGEDVDQYDFLDLLEYYERDGLVLGGGLGVSPTDVYEYFASKPGYSADLMYGSELTIELKEESKLKNPTEWTQEDIANKGHAYEVANDYDAYIINVWNNKEDASDGMHFMTISKNDDGKVTVHNEYSEDGILTADTLELAIRKLREGAVEPISLIGVKKNAE